MHHSIVALDYRCMGLEGFGTSSGGVHGVWRGYGMVWWTGLYIALVLDRPSGLR